MLKVGVIGCGNCGNQIAALAFQEGIEVYCFNTSENDLSMLPEGIKKKCIGDSEGSGKNREEAKEFFEKSIAKILKDDEFGKFIISKDVIVIASSMGGGTGSGLAPVMSTIIKRRYKNGDGSDKIVILAGVLPKLAEGLTTQVNATDYIDEVFNVVEDSTYIFYDNNKYAKKLKAHQVLKKINEDVVRDIKIMQCSFCTPTPYDSIDEKDMKTILSTKGGLSFVSLMNMKEKDTEDIEDLIIEQIKTDGHCEIQQDCIVRRTGLITNISESFNDKIDTNLNKVRALIGEPVEEFLHMGINPEKTLPNNVFLVMAGLSKPSDRITKIKERIDEINENQDKAEQDKADDVEVTAEEISNLNKKRDYREQKDEPDTLDANAIFSAFKKKK